MVIEGFLNFYFVNFFQGVEVTDMEGNKLGTSKKAGILGLSLSAVSRVVWNIPALGFPPLMMNVVKRQNLAKTQFSDTLWQLGAIGAALSVGL